MMITGLPILSRRAAPAAWTVDCWYVALLMNCTLLVEGVEDGVAHCSVPGPLSVVDGLRPEVIELWCGEALLNDFRRVS